MSITTQNHLGNWAVIDIETTGIDSNYDEIIDIGFLEFDGLKLVKKYSSLVRSENKISKFIEKLTGINSGMMKSAPSWDKVSYDVHELYGHNLIAHNSDFEKAFLEEGFSQIDSDEEREKYWDSMYYLGLLFPEYSSLKLEKFIIDWEIRQTEAHRGFEDSLDLLKVMLVATALVKKDMLLEQTLKILFLKHKLTNFWFYNFFSLNKNDLETIALEIDFNLERHVKIALDLRHLNEKEGIDLSGISADIKRPFSLEFSGKNISDIFNSEEKIKEALPFYNMRSSQVQMSLKTGQAFKNNIHSLIQAPTGTGKTLGYLVPSALCSLETGKKILIATGTKTLQHQAMTKDLPNLYKFLGISPAELRVKSLIGSNNHLCELFYRQHLEEEDLINASEDFNVKFTNMFFELVFYYNSKKDRIKKILRGDIPYVFKRKVENFDHMEKEMAVDYRSCTGTLCPFKADCSYVGGLKEAKDANIIIGNHALMFSWPRSFPRPEYIVIDEAHKIENETTSAFSIEVGIDDLNNLNRALVHMQGLGSLFYLLAQNEEAAGDSTPVINNIREEANGVQAILNDHLIALPDLIQNYFMKLPRYTDIYWNETFMVDKKKNGPVAASIYNTLESILFVISGLNKYLLPYSTRWESGSFKEENDIIAFTRFEKFIGNIADIELGLKTSLGVPDIKPDFTRTLKYHAEYGFTLTNAPINIGKILHENLLETTKSVVYTSATLGNAKGDRGIKGIEWATGYSYVDPSKRFKSGFFLPPNIDYTNNTKVFLCDDTLPFYDREFVPKTMKTISKLIRNIEGRSLLLFSAKKRFEEAREVLLNEFEGDIPLFIQGMGNNIIDEFKESSSGILLGMESFGEGIDIPGKKLEFIFIDKIPDLRMDKVIQDRRDFFEANIGNEFTDYYLAHRTRALHQKLGRLLRRETDIGGVIVVDARIKKWKGNTMEKMLKLMEPYKMIRTQLDDACVQVEEFIKSHDA